jgi:peptidoglycan/xylan/chitin deacetylase (PgdA/CDA1 family)
MRTLKLLHPLASVLSGSGSSGKLQILIYHRVLPSDDPLQPGEPSVADFTWQMEILKNHFQVLPLSEAISKLKSQTLPARAACITFDDGYADNLHLAAPVLASLGLPATVFVATDYLDGGIMFNDITLEVVRQFKGDQLDLTAAGIDQRYTIGDTTSRLAAWRAITSQLKYLPVEERQNRAMQCADMTGTRLPRDLMLKSEELVKLKASGVDIGAHTHRHPILKTCSDDMAAKEISDNKSTLQQILGHDIELFAYPNGVPLQDYSKRDRQLVKQQGFKAAVSTSAGTSRCDSDIYQLNRFTPWDRTPARFYLRLLKNYLDK